MSDHLTRVSLSSLAIIMTRNSPPRKPIKYLGTDGSLHGNIGKSSQSFILKLKWFKSSNISSRLVPENVHINQIWTNSFMPDVTFIRKFDVFCFFLFKISNSFYIISAMF
jgi:hypothetical protein